MILKTGPTSRPVMISIQSGQLERNSIKLGSNNLNQRSNREPTSLIKLNYF